MLFYFLVSVADVVAWSLLVILPCNTIILICDNFASFVQNMRQNRHLRLPIQKAALSPQLFKDPECWSNWSLNPWPPAQQHKFIQLS